MRRGLKEGRGQPKSVHLRRQPSPSRPVCLALAPALATCPTTLSDRQDGALPPCWSTGPCLGLAQVHAWRSTKGRGERERVSGRQVLPCSQSLLVCGAGVGVGDGGWGGHRPPRVTQEAAPREKLARTGQRPALLPSARSGVPSAKGADRLRGAGARRACATPADAALKQLAFRWLRRRSNEGVRGSQGRKRHRERTPRPAGGRGAAVHGGWPGRPPEWAPCRRVWAKKGHIGLTVSEGPSGQRLESDRGAEAERDHGCFWTRVGGSQR